MNQPRINRLLGIALISMYCVPFACKHEVDAIVPAISQSEQLEVEM